MAIVPLSKQAVNSSIWANALLSSSEAFQLISNAKKHIEKRIGLKARPELFFLFPATKCVDQEFPL